MFPRHSWSFRDWASQFQPDRHWLLTVATVLMVVLLTLNPLAHAKAGYPPFLDPHVNNYGQTLTPSDVASLRSTLKTFQAESGKQIVVVTVRSIKDYKTGDQTIESFATNLFNTWGIGNRARNDGAMVLVASGDRTVRIELGRGYAASWDREMKIIIQEYMLPSFKQGQFSQGTVKGTQALVNRLSRPAPDAAPSSNPLDIDEGANSSTSPLSNPVRAWDHFFEEGIKAVDGVRGAIVVALIGFGLWFQRWLRYRKRSCPKCNVQMVRLDERTEDQYLDRGKQLEEKLHSVDYDVWLCPQCKHRQVKEYRNWSSPFSECPQCHNRTLKETCQTISRATTYSEGNEEVSQQCRYCSYSHVYQRSIPRLSHSDSYSSSSDYSSSDYSSSSSDDGGSSSGGGSSDSW